MEEEQSTLIGRADSNGSSRRQAGANDIPPRSAVVTVPGGCYAQRAED